LALFKKPHDYTFDRLREKLAAAEAAVSAAEDRLRSVALDAALAEGDGPDLAADARRELRAARNKVEDFQLAIAEAERLETERQAKAKAELRASNNRAVRAQISVLVKAAKRYQDATGEAVAAFNAMLAAGDKIKALLPGTQNFFASAVSYRALKEQCLVELARVGAKHPVMNGSSAPGANWDAAGLQGPLDQLPLSEAVRERLQSHYRVLTGEAAEEPAGDPAQDIPTVVTKPVDVELPPATPAKIQIPVEPVIDPEVTNEIRQLVAELGAEGQAIVANADHNRATA
jgi:hypothetical protein